MPKRPRNRGPKTDRPLVPALTDEQRQMLSDQALKNTPETKGYERRIKKAIFSPEDLIYTLFTGNGWAWVQMAGAPSGTMPAGPFHPLVGGMYIGIDLYNPAWPIIAPDEETPVLLQEIGKIYLEGVERPAGPLDGFYVPPPRKEKSGG